MIFKSILATNCPTRFQYQPEFSSKAKVIQDFASKPNIRVCRNACEGNTQCRAFAFNPEDNNCKLLGAMMSDENENIAGTNTIFCAARKYKEFHYCLDNLLYTWVS